MTVEGRRGRIESLLRENFEATMRGYGKVVPWAVIADEIAEVFEERKPVPERLKDYPDAAPLIQRDTDEERPVDCERLQQSDEYYCARCHLRWGVDDHDPPPCGKTRT